MPRLPAIALILLTAGCARERVAYEITLQSQPVSRRTARRAHHEPGFPPSAYVHGDARHRCDARCETYWPDVYPHGHLDHHCDTSCASYRPPRPASTSSYRYQTPTYVASPLTGTRAGVQVGSSYDDVYADPSVRIVYSHGHARHRCDRYCSNHPNARPSGTVQIVYAHGHARHRCDRHCSSYVVVTSHGQAGHRCHTGCSGYSWPHGHVRHRCGSSCNVYDYPHGHSHHVCGSLCVSGVAVRSSNGRFELRIGGNRPHGDRFHACNSACSFYTPPSTWYAHGHRLHACGRGCALFNVSVSTRHSTRHSTSSWSHRQHDHGRWTSHDRHRGSTYRSHRSRSRGGVDIGFGIRIR